MKPFYLANCLHDSILSSFIFTVEDVKSRSQEKHVKLCSNFSSLLSNKTNSLFQRSLYHFLACKLSLSSLRVILSFTSKNLSLISCFGKSKFCWQQAEIQLPYHFGSIHAETSHQFQWKQRFFSFLRAMGVKTILFLWLL